MAEAELYIVVKARNEAQRELRRTEESITSLSRQITGISNTVTNLIAGGVIARVGKSFFDAFADSAKATAQLNAALKSTQGIAGVTEAGALQLADALSKIAPFEDEAILSAENLLLTFTRIGGEIFPDTTKAVLDMSVAMGQDLKSSAIQIGKALNEPIEGAAALRRVGVQLTDSQEALIKKFVESGDVMSAQKIILEELQTEFGGAAQAAGDTLPGQLTILGTSLGNIQEAIAGGVLPQVTPLVKSFSEYLPKAFAEAQTSLEQLRAVFVIGISAMSDKLADFLNGITSISRELSTVPIVGSLFADIASGASGAAMTLRDVALGLRNVAVEAIATANTTAQHAIDLDLSPGGIPIMTGRGSTALPGGLGGEKRTKKAIEEIALSWDDVVRGGLEFDEALKIVQQDLREIIGTEGLEAAIRHLEALGTQGPEALDLLREALRAVADATERNAQVELDWINKVSALKQQQAEDTAEFNRQQREQLIKLRREEAADWEQKKRLFADSQVAASEFYESQKRHLADLRAAVAATSVYGGESGAYAAARQFAEAGLELPTQLQEVLIRAGAGGMTAGRTLLPRMQSGGVVPGSGAVPIVAHGGEVVAPPDKLDTIISLLHDLVSKDSNVYLGERQVGEILGRVLTQQGTRRARLGVA